MKSLGLILNGKLKLQGDKLKKILILQGGFNEEHTVSLNTAKEVSNKDLKFKIIRIMNL